MRSIKIDSVSKSFNNEPILEDINLVIPGGKFFALLGPSGSGKTTLLRLIAGLETVDSGTILLGDKDITYTPINERAINTVFQNYALFPHMDVFDNVAYALAIKQVPKDVIDQKVMKVLRSVRLDKYAHKAIQQLSGGQQQRVALARAVVSEPDVLLLDEPLAALDLKLREQMLIELIELQDTLKTTFVYVTHDQFEALTVADQMAIMNQDGQIEQVGTPKEIYEFPISTFVAQFVGTTNIIRGVIRIMPEGVVLEVPLLGSIPLAVAKNDEKASHGAQVALSVRPEKIEITKKELSGFSTMFTGTVESIVYHGRSTQYNVRLSPEHLIHVFEQNEEHFETETIDYDDMVYLYWQKENVVMLER
jgi:spermidine/putrescine transport system ATP-binding protein